MTTPTSTPPVEGRHEPVVRRLHGVTQQVRYILMRSKNPMNIRDLGILVGVRAWRLSPLISPMVKRGEVRRVSRGVYQHNFRIGHSPNTNMRLEERSAAE